MSKPTLEAKVKDTYQMGPVVAFSGHEFIRNEWRDVPAGFGPAALVHPLLDVREKESQEEIHVTSQDYLADTLGTADETVASEPRTLLEEEAVTAVTADAADTPVDDTVEDSTASETAKDLTDEEREEMVKEKPQRTSRSGRRSRKE